MKEGYKQNMNKMSIDVARLLYDNVVASDILKIHESINNFAISSKEIIDLENSLIINSFYKNKLLFSSKYLYYKLSVVLKDISLCIDEKQVENIFIDLLNKSLNCLTNNSLDDFSKIEYLNQIYLNEFYKNFIDQTITAEDIFKVHLGINRNNQAFSEIITLENKILINSIKKSPAIYANKLAYYKLAMQIKGLGLKFNNEKQADEIFNKLLNYTNLILEKSNIDIYTKLNILDFLYFKYDQLDFSANKDYSHQLSSFVNKEIKQLLNQSPKNSDDKNKEKRLVYSMVKKECPV